MSEKPVLPHSQQAENVVLGSMMLRQDAVNDAIASLRPEDFYHTANQRIFDAARTLCEKGVSVDTVSVAEQMERDGTGGKNTFAYLSSLVGDMLPGVHIEQQIGTIREKAALRQLAEVSQQIYADSCDGKTSSEELIAKASDDLYRISMGTSRGQVLPISDAVLQSYVEMSAAYKSDGGMLGVKTGFPQMDRMLSGLQSDQLVVIAGRPGMGKTSFAMNIVEHASIAEKKTCLVFSMEMSASQLATRLLCANACVDMQKARTGSMDRDDFDRMGGAMRRLSAAPIYLDDSATIAVPEMTAKARRLQSTKGLGLVVIDYLQLMSIPGRTENRNQEISRITRSLKIMAKQLGVPVVLLSQLSRATERDSSKFPKLSDLRDSGAIEQDADVVIFLQRDDYYAENRTEENIGRATILIAKQRNGPTGPIEVRWDGQYTRYVEIDPYHAEEDAPGETPWNEPEGELW